MRIILEELKRREALATAIDGVLEQFFVVTPHLRIKRGLVHEQVARSLNLVLNNALCLAVKDQVMARGGRPYISRGSLYYGGLTKRRA